jgi:hypothetical protein
LSRRNQQLGNQVEKSAGNCKQKVEEEEIELEYFDRLLLEIYWKFAINRMNREKQAARPE